MQIFRIDQDREIMWEYQQQMLQDFERIASQSVDEKENAAAALQVSMCYILGFGTSVDHRKASEFFDLADERCHPVALLFGEHLKSALNGSPDSNLPPYCARVVNGFKAQWDKVDVKLLHLDDGELPGYTSEATASV